MPKLSNDQLLAAIEHAEGLAEQLGEVSEERVEALRYYLGENTNPAPDGRSQVVSRDIWQAVEAIKPSLLRTMLSGEKVVEFAPRGPEDIAQAEQETAYVNHVIVDKNDAFRTFCDWIHDGLVSKTGYVLCEYREEDRTVVEKYAGLSADDLTLLTQDKDIEIAEAEQLVDAYGQPMFNVSLKRKDTYGCVKMRPIPPERVYVDAAHERVSLQDANFVEWRERVTISDLRLAGYKVEDDINDGGSSSTLDYESDMRDRDNPWRNRDDGAEPDPSMRKVTVRKGWIRTDADGDGEAQLVHFVVVGKTFLDRDDADIIPMVAWAPFPLPHQHYGLSVYDVAKDLQDVKTALQRGVLDATYLGAAPRFAIDSSRVNLDDMLVSRPGGIVRVEGGPSDAIFPLSSVPSQNTTLPVIEYIDSVAEQRTGITRYTQGLDANSLNKTATGINIISQASQMRLELIARQFAEAVKELFYVVHALTLKHARKAEVIRLNGQYVPVDPRTWVKRSDLSISVGLGNGNRDQQQAFLLQMLNIAFGPGMQMGLTDPKHIYNMLSKLTNNAGFKSVEELWTDPTQKPPQPSPPPPEVIKAQMDAQAKQAQMQLDAQTEQSRLAVEKERLALDKYKADLDAQIKLYIEQLKAGVQQEAQQAQMSLEGQRLSMDGQRMAREEQRAALEDQSKAENGSKVDSLAQATQDIIAGLQMLQQQIGEVSASSSAPREVVRDPATGRVVGVKMGNVVRQVARDAQGRVTGIQ